MSRLAKMNEHELHCLARRIAADKMGLVIDKYGINLPDDLWMQCIPDAEREMSRRAADTQDLDIFADQP